MFPCRWEISRQRAVFRKIFYRTRFATEMNRVAQGYCKSSIVYYHVKQTPAKIVSTFKKFSSKAVVASGLSFLRVGILINETLIKFELIFYINNIIINVSHRYHHRCIFVG